MGIRVHKDYLAKVRAAVKRNGYPSQGELAIAAGLAPSTVHNFLTGKNVFTRNFQDICEILNLDWQEIFDREIDVSENHSPEPILPEPIPLETSPKINQGANIPITIPSLEYPGAPVAITSPFYILRPPKEQDCYHEISKPGALIRIKAPKQMGKTSLLFGILDTATKQGDRTVYISLQEADKPCFTNLDKFLRWFCATITRKLKLENKLDEYWEDDISCNVRCETYLEEYILPEITQPLTLGLDEVDRLFAYPDIYGDFFGLIRYLHEESKRPSIWQKLRIVIAHSTEPYIQLDINRSPFNAGFPVELSEFTTTQVLDLAQRHQLHWSQEQITEIMSMIGGHPFLARLALYHISRQDITWERFLATAPTESGIYAHYLHRLTDELNQQPELALVIPEIMTATAPVQLPTEIKFKLQAMGLVHLRSNGVTPRCHLYQQYFIVCANSLSQHKQNS
ncbi:AAA-like domain-containing protein [Calothrix sp. 336/3]|uniref:AAA-like domain-containing protein n=1 Tax=Calothrix sp. 336/3 TaxID=1337936 RepID=UPI0004E2EA47|nr:AAA-like domain-containing protein [Calothrix sp. 336/3]AKG22346.1 serine/threonine protein kinase [Calothrix sp. 336/3]